MEHRKFITQRDISGVIIGIVACLIKKRIYVEKEEGVKKRCIPERLFSVHFL